MRQQIFSLPPIQLTGKQTDRKLKEQTHLEFIHGPPSTGGIGKIDKSAEFLFELTNAANMPISATA